MVQVNNAETDSRTCHTWAGLGKKTEMHSGLGLRWIDPVVIESGCAKLSDVHLRVKPVVETHRSPDVRQCAPDGQDEWNQQHVDDTLPCRPRPVDVQWSRTGRRHAAIHRLVVRHQLRRTKQHDTTPTAHLPSIETSVLVPGIPVPCGVFKVY